MAPTLAFIGCGKRAQDFAQGVRDDGRARVAALADPNAEAAQALAKVLGQDAPVFTDYRTMLKEARPEIVVTPLWTKLHLPVFRDCVEAGVKAVICEKPMAITWPDCQAMSQLAEESGVQLTFCHQRRFAPGNQLARKLIAEGVFGQIERLDLYSPPHLLDCGTHTFDQALSFLGEREAKWVLCGADLSSTVSFFDVAAEAMSVGQVVFENGVRASFQFGGPDLDIWGGIRVYGSKGMLEIFWDGNIKKVTIFDDPDWQWPGDPEEQDRPAQMTGVIRDCIDSLAAGTEPELSHRKALRAAEIIFACYESIRRRSRIELPLKGVQDHPLHSLLAEAQS